jgi:DNA helicase-2/ATP-dependent DNA helicase PcrA
LKYTPEQEKAINFMDGNTQIIACPGSGKTEVITRRIANLVNDGVEPGNTVAFTFTEKAAEEMKFRIRYHLQKLRPQNPEIGDMYVGTIHSFCYELLKQFKPKYRGYDVLDEHTRMLFLSNYANYHKVGLHRLDRRSFRNIDKFCRSVDVVREEMIDPEQLPPDFKACHLSYLSLLDEQKFLDFSGMMFEVVELLKEDKDFLGKVREKYQYITVDEYQDVNPLQEKLIRLITGENGNLCVVGDDDQSIYQWRGTKVDNILTFSERYENVTPIDIVVNFRSSDAIISSAKKLIEKNPLSRRLVKGIRPWEKREIKFEKGDIYAVFFEDLNEEIDWLIEKIQHLRGTKYVNNKGEEFSIDYRDMAIFFRSVRTSAEPLIKAFKKRGIDYIVKGGGKLFEQDEVALAMMCVAFLGDFRYDGAEVTPQSLIDLYCGCFQDWGNPERFVERLETLKGGLGRDSHISLQEVYQRILAYMGANEFEFKETQLYNLGMLSQSISNFETIYKRIKVPQIKYFLGFIKGYGEWNYEEGGQEDPTKVNAVKIMTIHRVKGLQFPVVFLPNLVSGRFPSTAPSREWFVPTHLFDINRYEGIGSQGIEDERRLFYVAITRSEKYLFLSGSADIPGLRMRKSPSAFFKEYPKDCSITTPIPDPTKRERLPLEKAERLKGFPTSYSDLRYYDRCPYDYKLRFIYGFNPQIVMALGYGRATHNLLNIIHTEYREKPPSSEVIHGLVEDNFFLRYAPADVRNVFKRSAERIVQNYVKKFSGDFSRILETEKPFEFAFGNGLISGSIDLIKKLDERGELEGIEIVDFKNKEDSEMATDYKKQLKLYAIASLRSLGLNPKKAVVHHLDDGTQTPVDITKKELEKTEKEVKDAIDKIMNRRFPRKGDKKKCHRCDWKYICPKE